jgi:hypothetical protein
MRTLSRLALLPILAAPLAHAGMSLVTTTTSASNSAIPAQNHNSPWRVEFAVHDWGNPGTNVHLLDAGAIGLTCLWQNGGDAIQLSTSWDNGGVSSARINGLSTLPAQFMYVRYQRDPATMTEALEVWDINGNRFYAVTASYPSDNTSYSFTGALIGGTGTSQSIAFFRIQTTLVPVNSRPPVTADNSNTLVHWKFDGTLADASGNGYSAVFSGGRAVYVNTPGQNLAVAFPKTYGAPSWSNWVSMRAGYPNQLDATASFSETDATPNVSYLWSQISGPTILRWSDRTQAQPTVTGAIFGSYTIRLTVTDAVSNMASSDLQVGAVATDDNGVVVNADPRADQIFGPMIAFGKNPWGYADQQAKNSVDLRLAAYGSMGLNPPAWATLGAGTVSYTFKSGVVGCTTLTANIGANDTSIPIAQASCLNLSQLPTTIMIGGQELVRISATTATSGPATLTVAYNGRGLPTFCNSSACNGPAGFQQVQQGWPSSTSVGQSLVVGNGTSFGTDPNVPWCPAGLPGPAGPLVYSSGSVTLTPSSTAITGSGTAFTSTMVNDFIRVAATHAGGSQFVYWGLITGVTDATHVTVGQPLPADVDGTGFSFAIVQPTYASLDFIAPDGSTQRAWQYLQYCESQNQAAIVGFFDTLIGGSSAQTGMHWSRYDQQYFGAGSSFGPNFYGEDLGHLSFYLRSGYAAAQTAATVMSRYWVKGPEQGGGWLGGIPLSKGGGALGAMANVILNPQVKQNCPAVGCLDWPDVRGYPGYAAGNFGSYPCDFTDTRDTGYMAGWLTLPANYDPNNAQRAAWKASLASVLGRESSCRRADNSWSNTSIFNNAGGTNVNLTHGSTAATGTGFTSGICHVIASGMVTVASGSSSFTGTGLVNGSKIIVSAGGKDYASAFIQTGGTSGNFSYLWPTASGTFPYVIENTTYQTSIAGNSSDYSNLSVNYACTYNSPTSLTLNKPWAGATGTYTLRSYVIIGYGQQPFFMGIKLHYLKWATYNDDPGIVAQASALNPLAGQWVHDVGYDPSTQGMNYARVYDWCEPATTFAPGQTQSLRQGECNYGGDPNFIKAARALTAETSRALQAYYDANGGSAAAVAWGDTAYGSLWGDCSKTTGGVYCDPLFDNLDTSNSNLASYKWTGFFFGMGMAHQWPAVRLGGVAAPKNRSVSIGVNFALAPKARVVVTAPSGAITTYTCTTAACPVTVDDRQGSHWYQVQYLSSNGKIVAQTDPDLLAVGP